MDSKTAVRIADELEQIGVAIEELKEEPCQAHAEEKLQAVQVTIEKAVAAVDAASESTVAGTADEKA